MILVTGLELATLRSVTRGGWAAYETAEEIEAYRRLRQARMIVDGKQGTPEPTGFGELVLAESEREVTT